DGSSLSYIPGRVWASRGAVVGPRLAHVAPHYPKAVSIVTSQPSPSEVNYRVEILGQLSSADPALAFAIEAELSGNVLMTREAVAGAYSNDMCKWEYAGIDVDF